MMIDRLMIFAVGASCGALLTTLVWWMILRRFIDSQQVPDEIRDADAAAYMIDIGHAPRER